MASAALFHKITDLGKKGIKKQFMLLLNLSMKYCEHTYMVPFHIVTVGRWLSWQP